MTLYLDPYPPPPGVEPCEICGPSYDNADIEYEGDGQWRVTWSYGCTAGGDYRGTRPEMIEWLEEAKIGDLAQFFIPWSIDKAINDLEEA